MNAIEGNGPELAGEHMTITESDDGTITTVTFNDVGTGRRCGDCQLCCRLLPMPPLDKAANVRCQHQRHRKGCAIHATKPFACRTWSCRWLADPTTAGLSRPDHCHYVIDLAWDYIEVKGPDGERQKVGAMQIWVDPAHRGAHRDPRLRAWLLSMAEKHGTVAIIRYGPKAGFVLVAPPRADGQWLELSVVAVPEHPLSLGAVVIQERE